LTQVVVFHEKRGGSRRLGFDEAPGGGIVDLFGHFDAAVGAGAFGANGAPKEIAGGFNPARRSSATGTDVDRGPSTAVRVNAVVEALFAASGSRGGGGTTVDPRDHDAGASVGQGNGSGTGFLEELLCEAGNFTTAIQWQP